MTVIVGFLIYGIYIIQGLVHQWEENVDITTIKNFSADVRDIQFPTVTICPKGWSVDRYGFIRAYLNEYDLTDADNLDEILKEWNFYLDRYYEIYEGVLKKNASKIITMVKGKYRGLN